MTTTAYETTPLDYWLWADARGGGYGWTIRDADGTVVALSASAQPAPLAEAEMRAQLRRLGALGGAGGSGQAGAPRAQRHTLKAT